MVAVALGVFLMLRAWRRGKRPSEARFACGLTVTSLVALYLASTPLVARWVAESLERQNPPVDPVTMPVADAIAALARNKPELRHRIGQVLTLKYTPDLRFRADETFDRLDETRRLFDNPTVQRDLAAPDGEADAGDGD